MSLLALFGVRKIVSVAGIVSFWNLLLSKPLKSTLTSLRGAVERRSNPEKAKNKSAEFRKMRVIPPLGTGLPRLKPRNDGLWNWILRYVTTQTSQIHSRVIARSGRATKQSSSNTKTNPAVTKNKEIETNNKKHG